MKPYGVIYRVVNSVNGKTYIGQTTADPQAYWKGHLKSARKGHRKLLYFAIRKHGEDAFTFEVIWTALNKRGLDAAEDFFIVDENTIVPFGYNMKGGGAAGKHSDELKKKRSLILREVFARPGVREELGAAIRASCADPEVRKHKSDAMARVWERAEHRERIAETNAKPEVFDRRSTAMRTSHGTPEFREAAKQRAINQFASPEAREAVRQRSLEQFSDPEKRERNRIARRLVGSRGNKGWRWITDGVESKQISGTDPMPKGWRYGDSHLRNAGKNWITDGTTNRMIDSEVRIPDGWRLGKTESRRASTQ